MSTRVVKSQAELDKAIADKVDWIEIRSYRGVWLKVTAYDSSRITAYDSSTVTAYGSSTVTACDSSTVRAHDSSTVTAYGSSRITAYGSSTVTACDSSTVRAHDSSTVRAYGSSTVTAAPLVAVHRHSATVNVYGGVVLDHSMQSDFNGAQWCEYHGVKVEAGIATVFKAVNEEWTTDRGVDYSPGSLPSCDDWSDTDECGGGLHFGPTPFHAMAYHPEATKFVACGVEVSTLRPVNGSTAKCKAPRVARPCVEVDIDGKEIAALAACKPARGAEGDSHA